MGVGEDADLGDAIAVTVIATGFNVDQQDEIVNTETKKIIHTLEDEQKAEQDLTPASISVDYEVVDPTEVPVLKKADDVIVHTLEDDTLSEMDLIPTTSFIRNFNVFYDEVIAEPKKDDDFVIYDIKDIDVVDAEVISSEAKAEEDQIAFSFDVGQSVEETEAAENTITFDLDDDVRDMDVKDHVEVVPVLEYSKEGETRYSLDDYMELENELTGAKSKAENFEPKIVDDELVFEKKTVPSSETDAKDLEVEADPMNTPIEELLKERADERRKKLKDFNHKFKNINTVDDMESKPAYQRQGIDLTEKKKETKVSRTTIGEDSNADVQLRSNNSFLHDNVD